MNLNDFLVGVALVSSLIVGAVIAAWSAIITGYPIVFPQFFVGVLFFTFPFSFVFLGIVGWIDSRWKGVDHKDCDACCSCGKHHKE